MALIAAKCTNCGSPITVDATLETGVCPHCGTTFITEKVIHKTFIQNTTNVTRIINGKNCPEYEEILQRGADYVKVKEYNKALLTYKSAIDISPSRYEAYFEITKLAYAPGLGDFFSYDDEKIEEILETAYQYANKAYTLGMQEVKVAIVDILSDDKQAETTRCVNNVTRDLSELQTKYEFSVVQYLDSVRKSPIPIIAFCLAWIAALPLIGAGFVVICDLLFSSVSSEPLNEFGKLASICIPIIVLFSVIAIILKIKQKKSLEKKVKEQIFEIRKLAQSGLDAYRESLQNMSKQSYAEAIMKCGFVSDTSQQEAGKIIDQVSAKMRERGINVT